MDRGNHAWPNRNVAVADVADLRFHLLGFSARSFDSVDERLSNLALCFHEHSKAGPGIDQLKIQSTRS